MGNNELMHRDRIQLSKRLLMSAGMVTPGSRVADIGCDHAHTDIWLIKNERAVSAIAMDVGEGPLSHAAANVRLYGLENEIELRLSDGLAELKPGEADSIIIAGMGGTLSTLILQAGFKTAVNARELILQPQSDVWMVRRFLRLHSFRIVDEAMCLEDGKYYVAMKAEPENGVQTAEGLSLTIERCIAQKNFSESLDTLVSDEYGRLLLERKNPVLKQQLDSLLVKNQRILNRIGEKGGLEAGEKKAYFQREREMLVFALEMMK